MKYLKIIAIIAISILIYILVGLGTVVFFLLAIPFCWLGGSTTSFIEFLISFRWKRIKDFPNNIYFDSSKYIHVETITIEDY